MKKIIFGIITVIILFIIIINNISNKNYIIIKENEISNIITNKSGILLISNNDKYSKYIKNILIDAVKCGCDKDIYYYDKKISKNNKSYKALSKIIEKDNIKDNKIYPTVIFINNGKVIDIYQIKTEIVNIDKITNKQEKSIKNRFKKDIKQLEDSTTCDINKKNSC